MAKYRWSILSILAVTVTGLAFAQTSPPPQQSQSSSPQSQGTMAHEKVMTPEQHLQMLSEKLNLTDDQKAKIKPILEGQAQQMKAIHEDTSLSEDQKKAKKKALHDSLREQINAVLTPEQQAKFKQMQQEHMGKPK